MSFLGNALASAAVGVFKEAVANQLEIIKANNPEEDYVNAIKSVYSTMSLLDKLAKKTKSKIDDKAVEIFLEPAIAAAEADGITL